MSLPPFIPDWHDLRPFVAESWLIITAIAVLLVPFFVRKPNTAAGTVTLVGLVAALVSLLLIQPIDESSTGRFAPMLATDGVALFWKALLLLFTVGVVLLWFTASRHHQHQGDVHNPDTEIFAAAAAKFELMLNFLRFCRARQHR